MAAIASQQTPLTHALNIAITQGATQWAENNVQGCVDTYAAVAEQYRGQNGRLNYVRNLHQQNPYPMNDTTGGLLRDIKAYMFRQAFDFIVYHQYDTTGESRCKTAIQYADANWRHDKQSVLANYAKTFITHIQGGGRYGGNDHKLLQFEDGVNNVAIIGWMYRLTFDRILQVANLSLFQSLN